MFRKKEVYPVSILCSRCILTDLQSSVISDIGASGLKPLFIAICSVTAVMFILSLIMERWFRHSGRLLPNMRQREKTFATLAILGATLGGVSLILLSIFDTARHEKVHRAFLVSVHLYCRLDQMLSSLNRQ